jgi:serine/threonine protein kinase
MLPSRLPAQSATTSNSTNSRVRHRSQGSSPRANSEDNHETAHDEESPNESDDHFKTPRRHSHRSPSTKRQSVTRMSRRYNNTATTTSRLVVVDKLGTIILYLTGVLGSFCVFLTLVNGWWLYHASLVTVHSDSHLQTINRPMQSYTMAPVDAQTKAASRKTTSDIIDSTISLPRPVIVPRVIHVSGNAVAVSAFGNKHREVPSMSTDYTNELNVNSVNIQTANNADASAEEGMATTHADQPDEDPDCVPLADWQTGFNPTCNSVHEMDMRAGFNRNQLAFVGQGWFRITWKWQETDGTAKPKPVVLKTLRTEREFLEEYYELHRRDAVAMERLTGSPFVVNVHGYCGQSAINEWADFDVPGIISLEDLDKRMRGQTSQASLLIKLRLAASIAQGLADIHAGGNVAENYQGPPLMVHYDLNPRNIALFQGAQPKINDFNIAEFVHINPKTNKTCPFRSRMHTPWWRAPEEVHEDEVDGDPSTIRWIDYNVDVYALGNLLFHILTTHAPRGKMTSDRMESVRAIVASGQKPVLEDPWATSKDPIVRAFRTAMDMCYHKDPKKRASAQEVALLLGDVLRSQLEPNHHSRDHGHHTSGRAKEKH